MKKQNLYNVTVYATLSKDVLVYAENEDAALNYVQDVCDNTDLISFDGGEILDVSAEEVEEIEPTGMDDPAEECCENCHGNRACCAVCGGFSCGRMADDEDANERKIVNHACTSQETGDKHSSPDHSALFDREKEYARWLYSLLGGFFLGLAEE
jgi:hypothetical protein